MTGSSTRFFAAAFLIFVAAVFLQYHGKYEVFPPRQALESFPRQLGPWVGTNVALDKEVLEILGPGDFLLRSYQKNKPEQASSLLPTSLQSDSLQPNQTQSSSAGPDVAQPNISLYIAYFRSQRAGDGIHSPKNCLPGAGWVPIETSRITLSFSGHAPFPANRYVLALAEERTMVLYWYWAHDRGVASEYWAKYYLIADSIRMNRSDGSLVRISSPMLPGETPDAAEQRILPFTASVVPLLDSYIPR
jgi:EpsI family protein